MLGNNRKIENLMAEKGLTVNEMANRAKMTLRGMSWILQQVKAGREIRPKTLGNVAKGLRCTVESIEAPLIAIPSPVTHKPARASKGRAVAQRQKAKAA